MSKIQEAYEKVFNSDGSIKLCGRGECINLIHMCSELEPTKNFGNDKTGVMNVESIKHYYNKLSDI